MERPVEQIPDRGAMVCCRQGVQVVESKAAPGRAQNGEPRDPIGRVQQRKGQRHQVLYHFSLAQLVDLNGLERDSIALQCVDDFDEMSTGTYQYRGSPSAWGADQLHYPVRFFPPVKKCVNADNSVR